MLEEELSQLATTAIVNREKQRQDSLYSILCHRSGRISRLLKAWHKGKIPTPELKKAILDHLMDIESTLEELK